MNIMLHQNNQRYIQSNYINLSIYDNIKEETIEGGSNEYLAPSEQPKDLFNLTISIYSSMIILRRRL